MSMFAVLIVGCGISGAVAAAHLRDSLEQRGDLLSGDELTSGQPFRIGIVEARPRLGGRTECMSLKIAQAAGAGEGEPKDDARNAVAVDVDVDVDVDVGGQWVGPAHSEMLALVKQFNLELVEQEWSDGQIENDDRHRVLTSGLVECVNYPLVTTDVKNKLSAVVDEIDSIAAQIDLERPDLHPKAVEWDVLSMADFINSRSAEVGLDEGSKVELRLFVQTIMSVEAEQVSFLSFLFYVKASGGIASLGDGDQGAQKWRVRGGCMQITEKIVEELLQRDGKERKEGRPRVTLFKGCTVRAIEQDDSAGTVTLRIVSDGGDGGGGGEPLDELRCRRVIFAAQASMVHKHGISFDPPLPEAKQQLSQRMVPGKCIKIIVAYRKKFWDSRQVRAPSMSVEDFSRRFNVHNIFTSAVGPLPALVCLITGASAQKLSTFSPSERRQTVLSQLADMYCGGSSSSSAEEAQVFQPVHYVERDWCTDEHSNGAYADVFPPGLLTHPSVRGELRGPFRRVHFAGTETATAFYGYMEGAARAGRRAAAEVIEAMRLEATQM